MPTGIHTPVAHSPPHPPQPRTAVYTGSFDPITLGHLDVIQRASRIFDGIVVGVGINPEKQPIFTLADRVQLVRESVADLPNVRVELFSGLSVAFVREQGAHVLLRGVRSLTDIDAEFTMTLANRKLDPAVETVFLMADAQYSHISSSLLKQITPLADDEALLKFVPPSVVAPLRRELSGPSCRLARNPSDNAPGGHRVHAGFVPLPCKPDARAREIRRPSRKANRILLLALRAWMGKVPALVSGTAGCHTQYQQTAFAKKKHPDAEEPVGGTRRSR